MAEIRSRLGIKLSGFGNIYVLFIVKLLYKLKENGCAEYIVPVKFLNAEELLALEHADSLTQLGRRLAEQLNKRKQ